MRVERGVGQCLAPPRARYFMTIPEAVQLIIRSGSLACGEGMATLAGADGGMSRAAPGAGRARRSADWS